MYKNSNNQMVDETNLETTHLTNSLSKKYRDIWNSQTFNEYNDLMNDINTLRNELHKRLNKFYEEKFKEGNK